MDIRNRERRRKKQNAKQSAIADSSWLAWQPTARLQCSYLNMDNFIEFQHQIFCSLLFSSISQSCPTLCNPMDCSMPGFPVHHQLPELTKTHVHRVSDAIQPSNLLPSPLLPPSIFPSITGSFPMSQLFASGG